MTTAEKTITTYDLTYRRVPDGPESVLTYSTRRRAEEARAEMVANPRLTPGEIIERHHTYHVGQSVMVRAYGSCRPGWVMAIARSRVTVNYAQNRQNKRSVRSFYPNEIRTFDVREA